MKKCCRCKLYLTLDTFAICKRAKDGLQTTCKPCMKLYRMSRRFDPQDVCKVCNVCQLRKAVSEFYIDRAQVDGVTGTCKSCCRTRAANNKPTTTIQRERSRRYRKRHPDKKNADTAYRRSCRIQATPTWVTYGSKEYMRIINLYTLASCIRSELSIDVHVDHITPLCPSNPNATQGLHVFANLRIISAKANLAKGNRSV